MARKDCAGQLPLEGRKSNAATAIALEQKLHEPVAEAADTIEEHDRLFVRHRSIMTRRANVPQGRLVDREDLDDFHYRPERRNLVRTGAHDIANAQTRDLKRLGHAQGVEDAALIRHDYPGRELRLQGAGAGQV